MANLTTKIYDMEFRNPIFTAAGPGAKDGDLILEAVKGGVGGIVTKTISEVAADVPRPCMAEIKGGFLNTELWSELPPSQWVEEEYAKAKSSGLPMIIGMGYTADQISKIAPMVAPFADAVELSTHYVGTDPTPMLDAMRAAKKALPNVPVFMKMSPHTDVQTIAKLVEDNGGDGIVMINSFGPCMKIDVETGYPIMGSKEGYGWLSGPAIHPLAVRCIYDAAKVVNIPIMGVGGVTNGRDAAEMLMAGASAVQICTEAILKGPGIYGKVAKELNEFLDNHGYKDVSEIVGLAHKKIGDRKFKTHAVPPVVNEDKCITCGKCKKSCVYEAITIEDKAKINNDKCFGCGLCVTVCPTQAIEISYK